MLEEYKLAIITTEDNRMLKMLKMLQKKKKGCQHNVGGHIIHFYVGEQKDGEPAPTVFAFFLTVCNTDKKILEEMVREKINSMFNFRLRHLANGKLITRSSYKRNLSLRFAQQLSRIPIPDEKKAELHSKMVKDANKVLDGGNKYYL